MPKALKLSSLAALAAAGLLAGALAAGGRAEEPTTTIAPSTPNNVTPTPPDRSTETTTVEETTTVTETTTVEHTTTRILKVPASPTTTPTTTSSSSSGSSETPSWAWVLIAVLAIGLIATIVLLGRRNRGPTNDVSVEQQRFALDAAVGSWAAQGWAIVSRNVDSAVLRRGDETTLVSVDAAGNITTRPLPPA